MRKGFGVLALWFCVSSFPTTGFSWEPRKNADLLPTPMLEKTSATQATPECIVQNTPSLAPPKNQSTLQKAKKSNASKKAKAEKKAKTEKKPSFVELSIKFNEAIRAQKFGSALAYCQQALDAMPAEASIVDRLGVKLSCAELYGKNERYEEQLALFREIGQDIEKENIAGNFARHACMGESTALTQLQRYEEARQKLEICIRQDDTNPALVGNLAELYMTEENLDESIRRYREAVNLAPGNPHAIFGLASALARNGQWEEALAQFRQGLNVDPELEYLDSAFFVPKAETDFQLAFTYLALHRYREAVFHLKKYVAQEERVQYKQQGQTILSQLQDWLHTPEADAAVHTYPVLLDNVRSIAIDATGRYIAFGTIERPTAETIVFRVHVLDTVTQKTTQKLSVTNDYLAQIAFVGTSTTLRVLGMRQRFELDVTQQGNLYSYENSNQTLAIGLSPNAEEIMHVSADNKLLISPWNDVFHPIRLTSISSDTREISLLPNHKIMASLHTSTDIDLVDTETHEKIATLPYLYNVAHVIPHPTQDAFVLGMQTGAGWIDTSGELKYFVATPSLKGVDAHAFDPTGKKLAILGNHTLEIWNVEAVTHPWTPIITRAKCQLGDDKSC